MFLANPTLTPPRPFNQAHPLNPRAALKSKRFFFTTPTPRHLIQRTSLAPAPPSKASGFFFHAHYPRAALKSPRVFSFTTTKGVFPHVPSSFSLDLSAKTPNAPPPARALTFHAIAHPFTPPAPPSKARAYLSSKEHLSCSAIKIPAPRHDLNSCPQRMSPSRALPPAFYLLLQPRLFKELNCSKPISPVPPIYSVYSTRSTRSSKIPLLMESNQMQ